MKIFSRILDKLTRTNTLYYPGCLTKYGIPEIQNNYEEILKKYGIDFIKIDNENCCGSPVLNAGYKKDFSEIVKKNEKLFRENGVKKIITNCPACFNMLKNVYPKYDKDWDFKVEHITQILSDRIQDVKSEKKETVFYHDPCHLGRHAGVYEEPRRIIEKLGFELEKSENEKQGSLCCGGGGGLRNNNIELSKKIAANCVKCVKSKEVITTCPLCYSQLKEFTDKNVKELSQCLKDSKK